MRVLRRSEVRGEIKGGRFVSGYIGEQFTLPEAVDQLHKTKNTEPDGRFISVSAFAPIKPGRNHFSEEVGTGVGTQPAGAPQRRTHSIDGKRGGR